MLYLLLAITSTLGLTIPWGFIVRGDATATAEKIASSQLAYRLCVVSDLTAQVLFVFLVLALYQLLKEANKRLAVLMVALVFVQVPMAFASMLCGIGPLVLSNGSAYWSAFDRHQLDALTMGFLSMRSYSIDAVTALWGLWLLPFGLLIFRSGFIPRIFGVFLIIACFSDLAISVTALLFPTYASTVQKLRVLGLGEIMIILWLIIKGTRSEALDGEPSVSGTAS